MESGKSIGGIFSGMIDVIKTYGGAENGIDIANRVIYFREKFIVR